MSPVVAHRLLKQAEEHDLIIIENDIFADFEHEHAPRLAEFDGLERVIHVGSFSKTLSAFVRCGYIAARGGMFLWCKLPAALGAADVDRNALKQGIVLAPGKVFSLSQSAKGLMRFNVVQSTDPEPIKKLETILDSVSRIDVGLK